VADFDAIQYLAGKGLIGKQGSAGEYSYPCFLGCGEPADSKKRKLYVNSRTGFYDCKVCGDQGGTYLLARHFGDELHDRDSGPTFINKRGKILEAATAAGQEMLGNNEELLLYLLNERGLSPETILERRLGYVGGRWSLTSGIDGVSTDDLKGSGLVYRDGPREGRDFFWNHLLIPYLSRATPVQLRGKVMDPGKGGRYMTGPGEAVRLYGEDDLSCEQVVITEGEFDAMVLKQHLQRSPDPAVRAIGVVGIPGAGALPEGFDTLFDACRRVYIALDPDEPGIKGAIDIKERLGPKARIVELPIDTPEKCDWTYFFTVHGGTWREAMALIGSASGKRLFNMSEIGVSYRNVRSLGEGLATGFAGLDAVVDPGLQPGQLVVLLAKTGTGKTIWLCNLAMNMREYPTLFVSLEQTREEVYERMQRIYRAHFPLASDNELEDGLSNILVSDANRLTEKDLEVLVEEFEVEMGEKPRLIIVDYLGYYARGMKGSSPYEKTSNAVMQLKAEAKRHRAVVVAPHQVNRVAKEGQPIDIDDARDSGVVEETADFLLSIWRLDEGSTSIEAGQHQPTGKLRLSLLKSRHGGKGKIFTLQMDPLTLVIVDDHTPMAKEASNNVYLNWRGVTYRDLRMKQTEPTQMTMGDRA
jgi:hypothetical protein